MSLSHPENSHIFKTDSRPPLSISRNASRIGWGTNNLPSARGAMMRRKHFIWGVSPLLRASYARQNHKQQKHTHASMPLYIITWYKISQIHTLISERLCIICWIQIFNISTHMHATCACTYWNQRHSRLRRTFRCSSLRGNSLHRCRRRSRFLHCNIGICDHSISYSLPHTLAGVLW